MRFVPLMLVALACAGPTAHERPPTASALNPEAGATARPAVASTLAGADPLLAKACELPTAPFVACPAPEPEPAPPPERHHHETAPAAPPTHPAAPPTPRPVPAPTTGAPRPAKVKDPICGMLIDPTTAAGGSVTRGGVTTHFCSATCKRTFLARVADGGTP